MAACIALSVAAAPPASAALPPKVTNAMSVTPIPITLSPDQTSALMQVANGTAAGTSFQIQTYAWTQSDDGKMRLLPSDNIVAFPSVFNIGPGKTRDIRVAVLQPPQTAEDTYRIIVQQLPAPPVPGAARIQVLAAFNLPVYLTTPGAAPVPAIASAGINHGALGFAVANTGTAHMRISKILVTGLNAAGAQTFQVGAGPGYVLAGGRRVYNVDLAPQDCARTSVIHIAANLIEPVQNMAADVSVSPSACAGAGASRTGFEGAAAQGVVVLSAPAGSGQQVAPPTATP
jgi:fimbrial chaperone protein